MREGKIKICKLQNTAQPGMRPHESLVPIAEVFYVEQTIGVTRIAAAATQKQRVDLYVKCPFTKVDVNAFFAMIGTEAYQIIMKQPRGDDTYLTLQRVEEYDNAD